MKFSSKNLKTILISRTDAIGDVILTLPLLGLIKKEHPHVKIIFLASSYTEDILKSCKHIDEFLNWTELSKLSDTEACTQLSNLNIDFALHVFPNKKIAKLINKARVPWRAGTRSRVYHWLNCNRLPSLSRKNSKLHEAQLNIQLAVKSGLIKDPQLPNDKLSQYYGLSPQPFWPSDLNSLTQSNQKKIILHPGSRKSARNWPLKNFLNLASTLKDEDYLVFLTGTQQEGEGFKEEFKKLNKKNLFDLTGKLSLKELVGFISSCDSLVACSTGPLHIAAALDLKAIGIYPPIRPIHPERWAPLGKNAKVLCKFEMPNCNRCKNNNSNCLCMSEISPQMVLDCL